MTDEINDYAPALLKIKAAIKKLETALPARDWFKAHMLAHIVEQEATTLKAMTVYLEEKERKAA